MANNTNFARLVSDQLPDIDSDQYRDIFNTLAQAVKITMEPGDNNEDDNLNAATVVSGVLTADGWRIRRINKGMIITDIATRIKMLLERYMREEDTSQTTVNTIRNLITDINNYLRNNIPNNNSDSDSDSDNGPAAAAGGRKRKSKKSRKPRKSRKSKKSRKSRKSRK